MSVGKVHFIAFSCLYLVLAGGPSRAADDLAEKQHRIDMIITDVMAKGPYPGISLAIEKGGEKFYEKGYGLADLENNTPVTADTVFAIGSVTKSFTALAIMQLVNKGKISLDASVGDYLAAYPGPGRSISIRRLLNHTSGIPSYTAQPDFPKTPRRDYEHEEILAFFQEKPLLFSPGEQWSYSNSNTFLLGMIIEKVSGQSYAAYVKANIIEPFGMIRTYYGDYTKLIPGRGRGYKLTPDGWVNGTQYSPSVPFSAGAMMSTAWGLVEYRRGVFDGDKTPQAVRDLIITRDSLNDGTMVDYALGCLIVRSFEGHEKISHSGDIYGFASHYAYYPDDNVTIVILTNNQDAMIPPSSIEHKVARVVLGISPPQVKDIATDKMTLSRYIGDYDVKPFHFGPDRYGFVEKDGKLHLQYGGVGSGAPLIPLLYQGKGTFISAIDNEHVFTFTPAGRKASKFHANYYDGRFYGVRSDK